MGWPRHKVTVVWRPCAIHPSCTQEHRQGDLCPTCKLELGASTLALAPAPALLAPAGHGAVNVDHPAPTLALTTALCDWGGAWAGHSAPAGTGIGTLALCRPRRRPHQHHDQHRRSDTGTRPGATAAATAATGTLGTVSTSTGPWTPHHRTTAAATSQRSPAWWWVWWLLGAARAARRSTRPDARAHLSMCHGVGAGPLPPRRRQTATSLGSAPDRPVLPPPAWDHDEQRPRRTATHDAARTPPPPPPPLGARLGQGMSRSKSHGGHGVGRRIGRDAPSDPRGWAPPAPPADDQPGGPLRSHLRHRCRTAHDPFPGPPKACVGLRGHELR